MEQMTKRKLKGNGYYMKCSETCPYDCQETCDCEEFDKFVDLLAAYEKTGLEPKEIEHIVDAYGRGLSLRTESAQRLELVREIPVDRLREIAEAEREGRCAVLPVKVGGTVYRVITTRDCPPLLSEISIKTIEQAASLIGRMGKHLVISYYPTREAAETALKGEHDG
jgi:hypothetical protein